MHGRFFCHHGVLAHADLPEGSLWGIYTCFKKISLAFLVIFVYFILFGYIHHVHVPIRKYVTVCTDPLYNSHLTWTVVTKTSLSGSSLGEVTNTEEIHIHILLQGYL